MFGDDNQQQQPAQDNSGPWQPPAPEPSAQSDQSGSPSDDTLFGAPPTSQPAPAADLTRPELPATGTPDPVGPSAAPRDDDLLNLKQQALQQLSPLVSHLDQTPEEKFRTTMMMIQASDDQSLIKSAFDAAQAITDDKARAQALLDVINEINYFTQSQQH